MSFTDEGDTIVKGIDREIRPKFMTQVNKSASNLHPKQTAKRESLGEQSSLKWGNKSLSKCGSVFHGCCNSSMIEIEEEMDMSHYNPLDRLSNEVDVSTKPLKQFIGGQRILRLPSKKLTEDLGPLLYLHGHKKPLPGNTTTNVNETQVPKNQKLANYKATPLSKPRRLFQREEHQQDPRIREQLDVQPEHLDISNQGSNRLLNSNNALNKSVASGKSNNDKKMSELSKVRNVLVNLESLSKFKGASSKKIIAKDLSEVIHRKEGPSKSRFPPDCQALESREKASGSISPSKSILKKHHTVWNGLKLNKKGKKRVGFKLDC